MMNISKVQAHKLPKAETSTLQLVQSPKGKSQFPWLFPDHFGIPWLFQVFHVSGHPATDVPFGALSGAPNVITYAKCYANPLEFLGGSTPKSAISYTYSNNPYNSSALLCRLW